MPMKRLSRRIQTSACMRFTLDMPGNWVLNEAGFLVFYDRLAQAVVRWRALKRHG